MSMSMSMSNVYVCVRVLSVFMLAMLDVSV